MSSTRRFTAMVVHGDGDVLDVLTRLLEASGFDVLTAINSFRAEAHLEGDRPIEVVVAPWDLGHPVGGEVYRWVLQHRPDLRSRFVFVADDVPPEFDAVVGGRCLAVPLAGLDELVRVASAVVHRTRTPPRGVPIGGGKPSLLLVDDDPLLLTVMAELLDGAGYAVSQVDGITAAQELLAIRDFDAVVVDWRTHDGSGADLYDWILDHKPHLAARVVFLAEADGDDAGLEAPGRPMFRKGQDSQALTAMLRDIVRHVRLP